MAKFDLKAYARQGAAARMAELNAELVAIYRAFPTRRHAGQCATTGPQRDTLLENPCSMTLSPG